MLQIADWDEREKNAGPKTDFKSAGTSQPRASVSRARALPLSLVLERLGGGVVSAPVLRTQAHQALSGTANLIDHPFLLRLLPCFDVPCALLRFPQASTCADEVPLTHLSLVKLALTRSIAARAGALGLVMPLLSDRLRGQGAMSGVLQAAGRLRSKSILEFY